jgi:hypothetical protein
MEEMPSQNTPFQRLKVAVLPLDLSCSGLVTHSGDISIIGKSHKKKPDGSSKDDKEMKKVLRFKYATWNIKKLGEKDKILNENNIKISVITESKKKVQGTKETENHLIIYSGLNRYTSGQLGVMIWIHKSISNKITNSGMTELQKQESKSTEDI